MAFDRIVVAMSWREGTYKVIESHTFNGSDALNWKAIEASHTWNDITGDPGYQDQVIVISARQFREYLINDEAHSFYQRTTDAHAFMYLIHRAEWESGLGD